MMAVTPTRCICRATGLGRVLQPQCVDQVVMKTDFCLNTTLVVNVATTMTSMAGRMRLRVLAVISMTAIKAASGACSTAPIIAAMPSMT